MVWAITELMGCGTGAWGGGDGVDAVVRYSDTPLRAEDAGLVVPWGGDGPLFEDPDPMGLLGPRTSPLGRCPPLALGSAIPHGHGASEVTAEL